MYADDQNGVRTSEISGLPYFYERREPLRARLRRKSDALIAPFCLGVASPELDRALAWALAVLVSAGTLGVFGVLSLAA